MATPLQMPKLGNTVEECFITKWHKHKGDAVAAGDVIADIETDKATFELTAPVDGVLLETYFEEGALVPVFTTLCVIGAEGETVEAFAPPGMGSTGAPPAEDQRETRPAEQAVRTSVPPPATTPQPATSGPLSPRARRFSREQEFKPASVAGTGPGLRVLEADLRRARDALSLRGELPGSASAEETQPPADRKSTRLNSSHSSPSRMPSSA